MIKVRITYSRTTDFLTDVEQQVTKRGLVLRVDSAGATLGAPVHLEIATPHGHIVIPAKVLQPLPGLGVAVEVEPGEFAELILKAKHRPVTDGAPPVHDALVPDPDVPEAFADVWATVTPPPPPPSSSSTSRLPRASTAPIPPTPPPPRVTPASTNPPFMARTATAAQPSVARTATSVPPTIARTASVGMQIVERTRAKPATTGSPVLPPIVEKARQKPTGSPMAPIKRPGTSPMDVDEPQSSRPGTSPGDEPRRPGTSPGEEPRRPGTSPGEEPRRPGTAPIDEPVAAKRTAPTDVDPMARTAPSIDIADGSSPEVIPPVEAAPSLADGSTPDAPFPPDDCDDDEAAAKPSQAQLNAQKIQLALHGDKNQRAAILREPNKLLHNYVLRNPQIQLEEIIHIARMATASIEILTAIANRREWAEKPEVAIAIVRNPKTPVPLAIKMLDHVGQAELRGLAKQQSVRDAIQRAARKKILG